MVDVAKVRMFGDYIGTFVWDDSYKVARFEYDNDFIGKGIEPSPLMMPVQQGRIYSFGNLNWDTFNGLPGMLADSLPDTYGRALFDKWLTLTGRKTNSPVESLCFLGERCMGALEFAPATSTFLKCVIQLHYVYRPVFPVIEMAAPVDLTCVLESAFLHNTSGGRVVDEEVRP